MAAQEDILSFLGIFLTFGREIKPGSGPAEKGGM
jgi:hypothetical protein